MQIYLEITQPSHFNPFALQIDAMFKPHVLELHHPKWIFHDFM